MTGMQTAPYQAFAKESLGFEFKDINYLITALTHRSYVNEHKKSVSEHNERLEFLGDAVLELVVTDYLFRNFTEQEGILTSWRASLVRTESIGEAGQKLGYESLVRMSKGEKNGSNRARQPCLLTPIFYRSSTALSKPAAGATLNHICKRYLSAWIIRRLFIRYSKKSGPITTKNLPSAPLLAISLWAREAVQVSKRRSSKPLAAPLKPTKSAPNRLTRSQKQCKLVQEL